MKFLDEIRIDQKDHDLIRDIADNDVDLGIYGPLYIHGISVELCS